MTRPPLTNPPPDLERGADYDTPQTYARIGRALMLFLFDAAHDPANDGRIAWLCAGVARVNGAPLFDTGGLICDPSADPSHWMNPRGSWVGAVPEHVEDDASVEWRCERSERPTTPPQHKRPAPADDSTGQA